MMEGVFSPLIFLFVSAFCFCSDPPYCFVRNEFVAFNSLKCNALPQFCVDTPCSPERGCLCDDKSFAPTVSPAPTSTPTPQPTNATSGACPRANFDRWAFEHFYDLECSRWLVLRDGSDAANPRAPRAPRYEVGGGGDDYGEGGGPMAWGRPARCGVQLVNGALGPFVDGLRLEVQICTHLSVLALLLLLHFGSIPVPALRSGGSKDKDQSNVKAATSVEEAGANTKIKKEQKQEQEKEQGKAKARTTEAGPGPPPTRRVATCLAAAAMASLLLQSALAALEVALVCASFGRVRSALRPCALKLEERGFDLVDVVALPTLLFQPAVLSRLAMVVLYWCAFVEVLKVWCGARWVPAGATAAKAMEDEEVEEKKAKELKVKKQQEQQEKKRKTELERLLAVKAEAPTAAARVWVATEKLKLSAERRMLRGWGLRWGVWCGPPVGACAFWGEPLRLGDGGSSSSSSGAADDDDDDDDDYDDYDDDDLEAEEAEKAAAALRRERWRRRLPLDASLRFGLLGRLLGPGAAVCVAVQAFSLSWVFGLAFFPALALANAAAQLLALLPLAAAHGALLKQDRRGWCGRAALDTEARGLQHLCPAPGIAGDDRLARCCASCFIGGYARLLLLDAMWWAPGLAALLRRLPRAILRGCNRHCGNTNGGGGVGGGLGNNADNDGGSDDESNGPSSSSSSPLSAAAAAESVWRSPLAACVAACHGALALSPVLVLGTWLAALVYSGRTPGEGAAFVRTAHAFVLGGLVGRGPAEGAGPRGEGYGTPGTDSATWSEQAESGGGYGASGASSSSSSSSSSFLNPFFNFALSELPTAARRLASFIRSSGSGSDGGGGGESSGPEHFFSGVTPMAHLDLARCASLLGFAIGLLRAAFALTSAALSWSVVRRREQQQQQGGPSKAGSSRSAPENGGDDSGSSDTRGSWWGAVDGLPVPFAAMAAAKGGPFEWARIAEEAVRAPMPPWQLMTDDEKEDALFETGKINAAFADFDLPGGHDFATELFGARI
jgi:hypothetical protein